jgi:uncharacterized LabA/DUF88 family protein
MFIFYIIKNALCDPQRFKNFFGQYHGALLFYRDIKMRKIVFMIDGWFMRKRIYKLKAFNYDGKTIRNYCKKHLLPDDQIYRIFYYDTEPFNKKGHNPISGKSIDFSKTIVAQHQNKLLESIKKTPNFALRLGRTVWRNNQWVLLPEKFKQLIKQKITISDIVPNDVKPRIEQKSVDMKIGIDIALIAIKRLADVLIIITGDSDIVPALKLARQEGMLVGLDPLQHPIDEELSEHVDFIRSFVN